MKICQNCNCSVGDENAFCPNCGAKISEVQGHQGYYQQPIQQKHEEPRCTHCGYVGAWKLGPVLRPMDIVIGIAFMFLGVFPGFIYLGVVAAIRSNKDRREKICPQCKAKNLWTFFY